MAEKAIDDLMLENRKFPPSAAFKKTSLVTGTELYDEGNEDYQAFWARQASELVTWNKDWDTVCEWNLPYAKWFLAEQQSPIAIRRLWTELDGASK